MFPVGPVPRLIIYSHMAVAVLVTACSQEWHFTGVNQALNKTTEQRPGMYLTHESGRAVDNKTNPDPLAGSCAQTESSFNPHWSVDLGDMYVLKGIRLYSRDGNKEAIRERMRNFQVIGFPGAKVLHDDKDAVPMLYANSVIDIPVYSAVPFSNITVQIATNETETNLALCEVQVFSVKNYCPGIQSDGIVSWNMRKGTGNVNTEKGLVSSGTIIDFACQLNCQLIGKESIVCLPSGSYDETIPTCNVKTDCPELQLNGVLTWSIRNGTGNVNSEKGLVSSGTVIDFACQLNYSLIGRESIVCLPSGSYDKTIPTCKYMNEPVEISSSALVAIAGAAGGAFVIGVAVGLLAALIIWKGRTRGKQTQQQTTRDTTNAAPVPGGNDYTCIELRALPPLPDLPDYMNV